MKTIDITNCVCRSDPERNDPMYRTPHDVLVAGSRIKGSYLFRTAVSI